MAHMLNSKCGPNITNQMLATFGEDVAQSTKANLGVSQSGPHGKKVFGGQIDERLGSRAINQKVVVSIPGQPIDVVSFGKALYPTCLWENVSVLTVSRSG